MPQLDRLLDARHARARQPDAHVRRGRLQVTGEVARLAHASLGSRYQGVFRIDDIAFARLVSLACHDLRTPLATVNGFARTLERQVELPPPTARYVEMIVAAAEQLGELIDELGVAARIQGDRYEPNLQAADSLALARGCAARLGDDRVHVEGDGADVRVDVPIVERGLAALAQSVLRHGGLDEVTVRVDGAVVAVEGVTDASAPVVLGEDLRDLGAAVAVLALRTLGGSVARDGSTLRVVLPQ
jgi:signal transduction histidine kinase